MKAHPVWAVAITLLLGTAMASAQVIQHPIEDFLATPGASQWYDGGDPNTPYVIVDHAGYILKTLADNGIYLPTKYRGTVTERLMPDGSSLVHVVLHGENVFVRAYRIVGGEQVNLLGYSMPGVIAGGTPVLGKLELVVDFVNLAGFGQPIEQGDWLSVKLQVHATGPLHEAFGVPEGTPGLLQMTQTSPWVRGNGVPGKDYYPAEHIVLKPIGK